MMLPELAPGQVCLGAALVVPEPTAEQVRAARGQFGAADASPPHITVIPPTPVPEAGVDAVVGRMRAAASRFGAIRVRLRGAGTFRPVSPVVYAALAGGFERCCQLEELVRGAVDGPEARFPYHPHVTVANGCGTDALDRAEAAVSRIDAAFWVDCLVVSLLGPRGEWRPRAQVALDAAGRDA
jgi:2'-5' RNA ligase